MCIERGILVMFLLNICKRLFINVTFSCVFNVFYSFLNVFTSWCMVNVAFGAAYGTAKSGTGIAAMAVMRPELIMKSIIPVVMSGIVAIYGLVVAVLISSNVGRPPSYTLFR